MTNDRITYYWNKYQDEIISFAENVMGYNIHCEDMVQDAFISLMKYDDQSDDAVCAILKGVIKKRRLMILRHEVIKGRHRSYTIATTDHFDAIDIKSGVVAAVYKNINSFPSERRRIFELRFFHGFRPIEIARSLNINKSTVNSQLNRSIDYLKKTIAQ